MVAHLLVYNIPWSLPLDLYGFTDILPLKLSSKKKKKKDILPLDL